MEITNIYHGTLDDGEFPKIVYKYRDWNQEHHERYIKNREVFMAPPTSFEDPLDCKIPVRYDLLNDKETIAFAVRLSKLAHPEWSRQQHRKDAREWAKQKLLKNQKFLDDYQKFYFEEYDQRLGILSVTAEPELEEMWKKYANNSTGFCVGYNSRIMFEYLGGGGNVIYKDELPILYPEPKMSWHEIKYGQVFFKERKWEFEKEYRTQKFWPNPATIKDRQIQLPKEAFNKVILGKNMSAENRKEIIECIKEFLGDIPILNNVS